MTLLLAVLVSVGLALALLSWTAQGRLLGKPARRAATPPPVSILKPLRGADPGLEENLASFFRLDHPEYEVVFAVADEDDPAVAVARRVMAMHVGVPARIVAGARIVGVNPKVDNLARAEAVARHEVLLISDSNVRVEPGYLADLAGHLQDGAALVTSLIRGSGESGLGGRLEALQLNTFVMGGVAAWATVFGQPCVVGKSMMLRRNDLRRIGGWRFLGRFLAEDQVCGEEIARRGGRIAVTGRPVDNRLGRLGLAAFWSRHLRWARIRRQITPAGYACELLLNPVGIALLGVLAVPGASAAVSAAGAWVGMTLLAWTAQRRLGRADGLLATAALELCRAAAVLAAWPVPFLSGARVTWRGRELRITRRSRLVTTDPIPSAAAGAGAPGWETAA